MAGSSLTSPLTLPVKMANISAKSCSTLSHEDRAIPTAVYMGVGFESPRGDGFGGSQGEGMAKTPKQDDLDDTKRLMGALVRMKPKPHEELKLGKKRELGKPSPRPRSRQKKDKSRNSPKAGG